MQPVTQLAHYRAVRQKPITDACAWSSAIEQIMTTHVKVWFAWQRTVWRSIIG